MREQGSFWAWCFPTCHTTVIRYRLQRVCRECDSYFREKYGELTYKNYIQLFLDYKERKGWQKMAIDPRTVPREVLLRYLPSPLSIETQTEGRGPGRTHEYRQGQGRGQPFPVHQPMMTTLTTPRIRQRERRPTPPAKFDDEYPGPVAGYSRVDQRHARANPVPAPMDPKSAPIELEGTPFPHDRTPSPVSAPARVAPFSSSKVSGAIVTQPAPPYIPNKNKPLPADPALFAVGDDDEEDYGDDEVHDVGKARVCTPSPVPKYHTERLPPGFTVVPELAHLAQGRTKPRHRRSRSFPEIKQPTPRAGKARKSFICLRKIRSLSDSSLVKKLTKIARDIEIPNLDWIEYEGKLVPRVLSPPKGRRKTRTSSPPSRPSARDPIANWRPYGQRCTEAISIGIDNTAVPEPLVPDKRGHGPSIYYVTARPDEHSPTGASARVRDSPTHASVAVPPLQRYDGVLIPSTRGVFYKERGLPSKKYVREEIKSATLAEESPVLVSVRIPERRYSAGVQACYCDGRDKGKCPSCRERDRMAEELNMTWI
ncbi:hypothetical protein ANO14919_108210 [Xylariales sp. No.14919]|nr:hypothetical protein ANO14919_108210 [Xylariales sp. No.14919]